MTDEPAETRRKKLMHRASYRGFREADILLGEFAKATVPAMTTDELSAFERLLDCDDHDIYAAVVLGEPAPAGADPAMVDRMRAARVDACDR